MSYGGGYNGGRTRMGTKVFLNVYDLSPSNDCLYPAGFGLNHSGVEILGAEYTFSGDGGIFDSTPKEVQGAKFRESIELGTFEGESSQLKVAISDLQSEFRADNYNILTKNCNHFANALVWSLLRREIPPYINRLATIGSYFSCLIPKKMLESEHAAGSTSSGGVQVYGGGGRVSGFEKVNQAQTSRSSFKGSSGKRLGSSTTDHGSSQISGLTSSLLGGRFSIGGSSDRGRDDLTDRRERARKAALLRLQKQPSDNRNDGAQ